MQRAVIEGGAVRGWLDDALERQDPAEPRGPGSPDTIGVVFVHGIGSQKAGETLLSWSDRLLRVVATWSASRGGPYQLVRRANIDFTGETLPYVEVAVPEAGPAHPAQTWIMTEAYWAARIAPPSISEMASWLGMRGEGVRVLSGLARGVSGTFGLPVTFADGILVRIAILVALGVALLLFALTRVLRLIPIGWLRQNLLVTSFDYFLGDWFGDVRVMLLDRVQAANVRSRLRRAIYALRARGCGPIVVVAHSGGTFVSYMTLAEKDDADLPATRLVTHGQALGLVWNLGRACDPPDPMDSDRLQAGDLLRARLSEARPALEWSDFWATHDPAPAGGFERAPCVVEQPAPERSHMVHNRASIAADHGAYWDNVEEFIVPVARLIETAGGGAASGSRLFADTALADAQARRRRRVAVLATARVWIALAALVALAGTAVEAWTGTARIVSLGQDAYAGLAAVATPLARLNETLRLVDIPTKPGDVLAAIVGLILVVLVFAGLSRAGAGIWGSWDDVAARAFLGSRPWPPELPLRAQLALVSTASTLAAVWVLSGLWAVLGILVLLVLVAVGWEALATRNLPGGAAPVAGPATGVGAAGEAGPAAGDEPG